LVVASAGFIANSASAASVSAVCSGGGQLCNQIATFKINTPGVVLKAKFTPGPLTCSDFRIHLLVDGTEVGVSDFVGPKQNTGTFSLGFVSPGVHTIGVQAEGEVGGCNVGNLLSWSGTLKLRKSP
jgi:hypothetical protein